MVVRGFEGAGGGADRGSGEEGGDEGGDGVTCGGEVGEAVVLSGVSVRYPGGEREVLRGVELRVGSGERVALLGLNGSGKSTLLLAVAGLLDFSGRIECCGVELGRGSGAAIRRRIGYLSGSPEDQLLFGDVLQDVAFSLRRLGVGRGEAEGRARELLEELGLGEKLRSAPYMLSQGERQRVALAGAVVAEPELLLLDEPSTALDVAGRGELVEVLGRQGSAMLVATHDLELARELCTRFVVLRGGVVAGDYESMAEAEAELRRGVKR